MLQDYGYLGLLLVAALLVPVGGIATSYVFGRVGIRPSKVTPEKLETYESGRRMIGSPYVRFNFRYYFFALLFLLFDVEALFLFPWAVALRRLELFGFIEMLVFLTILGVGLLYAWRKKALEWV